MSAKKQCIVTTSWDDGHVADLRLATLLKQYGIPGTFYIAPDNHEIPKNLRLTPTQIKQLSNDFEIGAHTLTHPKLTKIAPKQASKEITQSKKLLEKITGKPVTSFCYPCGDYSPLIKQMVRAAGFTYARTTERFWANTTRGSLDAPTTIHAYRHYSDLFKIARFAKWRPLKALKYLLNWEDLAIAQFEQIKNDGGVFHLWGHSWEIDKQHGWSRLEKLLAHMSQASGTDQRTNADLPYNQNPRAVFASAYFPPHVGGLERYEHYMASSLAANNYDIAVITSGQKNQSFAQDDLRIYQLKTSFKLSNTPIGFMWPVHVRRLLKQLKPDIINVHMPVPVLPDIVSLSAKDIPLIVTYHSGSIRKMPASMVSVLNVIIYAYERLVLPQILGRASTIICSSAYVRDTFLSRYASKCNIITPGVDVELFTRQRKVSSNNRVLFVGNYFNPWKGMQYLQKAIAQIPQAKLVIVGNGPTDTNKQIEYLGVLSGEKLVAAIKSCSVMVLPSISKAESFGMVLIEAMACGVPVIGSRIGGIPTIIDHQKNGLLCAAADDAELVDAISLILSDKKIAQQYADAAYNDVVSKFLWQQKTMQFMRIVTQQLKVVT